MPLSYTPLLPNPQKTKVTGQCTHRCHQQGGRPAAPILDALPLLASQPPLRPQAPTILGKPPPGPWACLNRRDLASHQRDRRASCRGVGPPGTGGCAQQGGRRGAVSCGRESFRSDRADRRRRPFGWSFCAQTPRARALDAAGRCQCNPRCKKSWAIRCTRFEQLWRENDLAR
jgi:hypothetical protein